MFVFASQDKTQKYRNTNTLRARREQRVGGGGGNGGHWGGSGRRRGHQSGMQLNSTMYKASLYTKPYQTLLYCGKLVLGLYDVERLCSKVEDSQILPVLCSIPVGCSYSGR